MDEPKSSIPKFSFGFSDLIQRLYNVFHGRLDNLRQYAKDLLGVAERYGRNLPIVGRRGYGLKQELYEWAKKYNLTSLGKPLVYLAAFLLGYKAFGLIGGIGAALLAWLFLTRAWKYINRGLHFYEKGGSLTPYFEKAYEMVKRAMGYLPKEISKYLGPVASNLGRLRYPTSKG